jgi:nucleoside-diphosphate-sugar epimerase
MGRILVTGAGGSLGANVVRSGLAGGHAVRALVRDPARALLPEGVEVVVGDALDEAAVRAALDGCGALFHCVNVVIGPRWIETTARLLDAAVGACAAPGARLVFPANVWVFGRGTPGALVGEDAPLTPCSRLGEARRDKEEAIRAASIRFVMIRLPEFYGPHVQTLMGPPLQKLARGRCAFWFGPADVPVELAYMPDAAEALIAIGTAEGVDGELFHLPGAGHATARELLALAVRQAGGGSFSVVPAYAVRAAALVHPLARAFTDILHLWEHPILLDGAKVRARFPALPSTPYAEGLAATLAWHRANPSARMYG